MIDIHTHCLPGIDDGASCVSESIEMLKESRKQGVRVVVATPHCALHHPLAVKEFLANRDKAMAELEAEMLKTDAELPKIIPGAEVYLDHDISDTEGLEKLCIGNTNYMLVEFARESVSPLVAEWLYSLNVKGIKPIVAHIDRYLEWEDVLNLIAGTEVLFQINAEVFLSFFGRMHVKKILEYGFDYIVSSDMHNVEERITRMKEAYRRSERLFPHLTKSMFWDNAYDILKSEL